MIMEWLNSMLESSTTPVLTALLLGLLTAISPCPLATNIAAIGYIGKDVENRRRVFWNGILYTLGRVVTYTVLGTVLIALLRKGASVFGLQQGIAQWGGRMLGPALVVVGLLMLFADRLRLPQIGIRADGERVARRGGWGAFLLGVLFALAFCPSSGIFFFGMLVPMAAAASGGWLLSVLFAVATALPVIVVAWLLAYSVGKIGTFYGRMKTIERWTMLIVGALFIAIGLYECYINYL